MDSHGHSYQRGHCPYCGREDWLIDGESDCNCKGRREAVSLLEESEDEE
jgi:hypothetical protein